MNLLININVKKIITLRQIRIELVKTSINEGQIAGASILEHMIDVVLFI